VEACIPTRTSAPPVEAPVQPGIPGLLENSDEEDPLDA
jgi:hypothetical protein